MDKVGIRRVLIQSGLPRGVCTRFGVEMSFGCDNQSVSQPVYEQYEIITSTNGDTQKDARSRVSKYEQ